MPIIVGSDEALKQYERRIILNKVGLVIFIGGMILLGILGWIGSTGNTLIYANLAIIIIGFILAYITNVYDKSIQLCGVFLTILAVLSYIISSFIFFNSTGMGVAILLFFMAIGILAGSRM